jgi:phage host-nuclease inhibitor protein Gam
LTDIDASNREWAKIIIKISEIYCETKGRDITDNGTFKYVTTSVKVLIRACICSSNCFPPGCNAVIEMVTFMQKAK